MNEIVNWSYTCFSFLFGGMCAIDRIRVVWLSMNGLVDCVLGAGVRKDNNK